MKQTTVRVSLTSGNRLSIYVSSNHNLFRKAYEHAFIKPLHEHGSWKIMLSPSDRGKIFRDRPNKGIIGIQLMPQDGDMPRMFGVCDAQAEHDENGEITITLPEVLPAFSPHTKRRTSSAPDPIKMLERAVRDINRCKDEIDGLRLDFNDKGKLSATVTVIQTIGGDDL